MTGIENCIPYILAERFSQLITWLFYMKASLADVAGRLVSPYPKAMAVGNLCSWHIQQSQTGPQEKGLARKHHANNKSQRGGLQKDLMCHTHNKDGLMSYSFSDEQVTNFPYETKKSTRPEPWLSNCINISLLHRGCFSKKKTTEI